jgi:hypothetical protein
MVIVIGAYHLLFNTLLAVGDQNGLLYWLGEEKHKKLLDPGRKAGLDNLDSEKMGALNRQQCPWLTEDEIVNELEDNEYATLLNSSISPADLNELGIVANVNTLQARPSTARR